MFSSDVDHSKFLAEDYESYIETPGFPYVRLHNSLIQDSKSILDQNSDELVLLVTHSKNAELLVITNQRIIIYKIPKIDSFLKKGVNFTIGLIPGVGELMDGLDNAKELKNSAQGFTGWITGAAKRKRLALENEGLPTKKDKKEVKWEVRKADSLALLLSYRDKILLKNGFDWKIKIDASLKEIFKKSSEIKVDAYGCSIKHGGKKDKIQFIGEDWNPLDIMTVVIENKRTELESAGWTIKEQDAMFIFRKE